MTTQTQRTFRIGDFQAVRPLHSTKWDIFLNGRCIESGIHGEDMARQFITRYHAERTTA